MKMRHWFSILSLLLSVAFWSGCQKEAIQTDCPDPVIPTELQLAGFFDGAHALLYATADDVEAVLHQLGAQPGPEGNYVMIAETAQGNEILISFALAIETAGGISKIAATIDASPELVTGDLNQRIYKNAECGQEQAGFTSGCYGPYTRPDGSTFTTHNEWYTISRCKPGTGYCVEVKKVIGVRKEFDLANCAGAPIRQENYYGYTCK